MSAIFNRNIDIMGSSRRALVDSQQFDTLYGRVIWDDILLPSLTPRQLTPSNIQKCVSLTIQLSQQLAFPPPTLFVRDGLVGTLNTVVASSYKGVELTSGGSVTFELEEFELFNKPAIIYIDPRQFWIWGFGPANVLVHVAYGIIS